MVSILTLAMTWMFDHIIDSGEEPATKQSIQRTTKITNSNSNKFIAQCDTHQLPYYQINTKWQVVNGQQ